MSVGDLAIRMKSYEEAARTTFPRRMPLIVRVDGKAFSKLTSSLKEAGQPFHAAFSATMDEVARTLCEEIQGAQLAYAQSDEVSVLVHGYKKWESSPWFDNQCQKVVSVAAALAASTFTFNSASVFGSLRQVAFDARAFVLPEHEVTNYFVWRQQDASRNSVQMLARSHFSHKECEGKSCAEMQEMLFQKKGVNWNDTPDGLKRGRIVVRRKQTHTYHMHGNPQTVERNAWTVEAAPHFTQARAFVEGLLAVEAEG